MRTTRKRATIHLGKEVHQRLQQLLGPEVVADLERKVAQEAADRIAGQVDRMLLGRERAATFGPPFPTPGCPGVHALDDNDVELYVEDNGRRRCTRPPKFLALRYPLDGRLQAYLTTKRADALVMVGTQTPPRILTSMVPKGRLRHEFVPLLADRPANG